MTEEQQKEQFSIAYVSAVAAVAGVNTYTPKVDDDSIDLGFQLVVRRERVRRASLEAQLKCSSVAVGDDEAFRFPLKVKNYNDLVGDDIVPRVLILVVVPTAVADWATLTAGQLTLRHAAYWVSLAGLPPSANAATVTVSVPKSQLFDAAALRGLLEPGVTS